jgi:hypothetical protein
MPFPGVPVSTATANGRAAAIDGRHVHLPAGTQMAMIAY